MYRWLALSLLFVACGGDDTPAPEPVAIAPEPATVVPEPVAPTEPPPVPGAPTPSPAPPPEPVPALPGPAAAGAEAGGAAFVVSLWTYGAGPTTIVVPVEPSTPARAAQRLLVLSPDGDEIVWVGYAGATAGCTAGCTPGETGLSDFESVRIAPAAFVASRPMRGLFTREPPPVASEEDEADDEEGEEDEGYGDDEGDEECLSSDGIPASIVGGRLYVPIEVSDQCGGLNVYNLYEQTAALFPGASAEPAWPDANTRCDPSGLTATWNTFTPDFDALPCRRGADGTYTGGDLCEECDRGPDYLVPRFENGRLYFYGAMMTDDGNGRQYEASVALTVSTCPSPADPCGPPSRFSAVTSGAGPRDRWWIATNASAALVAVAGAGRTTLRLFPREATAPSRELTIPFDAVDVLSVRFHADVGPLARVIDHGLGAGSVPTAPGACAPGTRRDGDGCMPIPLAAADATFEDTSGGTEWGNRCAVHLREGDLDAAEAACARGLSIAERASTEGALWFNLGRIAERRGDVASARRAYERSLEVRPGNATVAAALAGLDAPAE